MTLQLPLSKNFLLFMKKFPKLGKEQRGGKEKHPPDYRWHYCVKLKGGFVGLAYHSHIKVIDMFFYRPLTSL